MGRGGGGVSTSDTKQGPHPQEHLPEQRPSRRRNAGSSMGCGHWCGLQQPAACPAPWHSVWNSAAGAGSQLTLWLLPYTTCVRVTAELPTAPRPSEPLRGLGLQSQLALREHCSHAGCNYKNTHMYHELDTLFCAEDQFLTLTHAS